MVCCYLMETLVCFTLLNGFLPDQLTVCDLGVCKLGPGGCECFILKKRGFYTIGFYQRSIGITRLQVLCQNSFTFSSAYLSNVFIACI